MSILKYQDGGKLPSRSLQMTMQKRNPLVGHEVYTDDAGRKFKLGPNQMREYIDTQKEAEAREAHQAWLEGNYTSVSPAPVDYAGGKLGLRTTRIDPNGIPGIGNKTVVSAPLNSMSKADYLAYVARRFGDKAAQRAHQSWAQQEADFSGVAPTLPIAKVEQAPNYFDPRGNMAGLLYKAKKFQDGGIMGLGFAGIGAANLRNSGLGIGGYFGVKDRKGSILANPYYGIGAGQFGGVNLEAIKNQRYGLDPYAEANLGYNTNQGLGLGIRAGATFNSQNNFTDLKPGKANISFKPHIGFAAYQDKELINYLNNPNTPDEEKNIYQIGLFGRQKSGESVSESFTRPLPSSEKHWFLSPSLGFTLGAQKSFKKSPWTLGGTVGANINPTQPIINQSNNKYYDGLQYKPTINAGITLKRKI